MNHSHTTGAHTGRGRAFRLRVGLLAALSVVAACDTDKLVNLQNPDVITGEVARDTANINELRNGVKYEFARALTGPAANNATPGIIGLSGVLSDEMWYASTFPTTQDIDRRSIDVSNGDLLTAYQYLHRARNIAERAAEQYVQTTRNNSADHAMVTNLAGFSYVLFAETFCSGVPFSKTEFTGELTFGGPYTTAQMLDSAISRFDQAIARATAAGSTEQVNLAKIGKARALLDKDSYAAAAAAVAGVPDNFVYDVLYSENSSGQSNGIWQNINSEKRSSAASGEGANGIVFFRRGTKPGNTIDPRAPVDSGGKGLGTTVPQYATLKYATKGAPVPLATGVEARLIEAEAALSKGTSNAYLPILNALRTNGGIATPLVDPLTADGRVRQFFTERAFWLWMTAHRVGDLRRMVRSYGYAQTAVWPTGQTINGSPYGSDVNFPVPFQEQNNPEAANGKCIDRNP
jgi:starch-binding outer membrane protein, SusD/RagB family